MSKINFADCKEKFLDRPLYCRPLRNLTPIKDHTLSPPKTPSPNEAPNPTGAIPKTIPGLPTSEQKKASKSQIKRDKKAKAQEKRVSEEKIKKNLSAFDLLMNTRHLQATVSSNDPRDKIIPSQYNRSGSFGSSPCLKRGSDQLGSPASPELDRETKKKAL